VSGEVGGEMGVVVALKEMRTVKKERPGTYIKVGQKKSLRNRKIDR